MVTQAIETIKSHLTLIKFDSWRLLQRYFSEPTGKPLTACGVTRLKLEIKILKDRLDHIESLLPEASQ